jgi:hypothetical protein
MSINNKKMTKDNMIKVYLYVVSLQQEYVL